MSVRVRRYLIYGLIHPIDKGLRYIGKTPKRREWILDEHIKHAIENNPVKFPYIHPLQTKKL